MIEVLARYRSHLYTKINGAVVERIARNMHGIARLDTKLVGGHFGQDKRVVAENYSVFALYIGIQPHAVGVGVTVQLFVCIRRYRHNGKIGGLTPVLEPTRKVGNKREVSHILVPVLGHDVVVNTLVRKVDGYIRRNRHVVPRRLFVAGKRPRHVVL